MVPKKTLICEEILESEGVFGDIHVSEFQLDAIPLEEDVMSLEMNETFVNVYLRKDLTSLQSLNSAIIKIMKPYGVPPKIIAKGELSVILGEQVTRSFNEIRHSKDFNCYSQELDSIVILERGLDLITPMSTQLTYEGLIDGIS